MRQIRKRRHGSGRRQPAPLPADARDPDIVHAHRVARRRQSRDHAQKRARGRPRTKVA
jgi:hypothetical protein